MSNALVDIFVRFDIIGLSPDSQEDEVGIKQAAENGMFRNIFSSSSVKTLYTLQTFKDEMGREACMLIFVLPF